MGLCRAIDTHEPHQSTDVNLYPVSNDFVDGQPQFFRGAAVARVIPVVSGHPQGHPFKSGRVHEKDRNESSVYHFCYLVRKKFCSRKKKRPET